MARINASAKKPTIFTHEGGKARPINAELELRRSVMACMLWEDSFYEEGISIANRIKALVRVLKPEQVATIAIEAREKMKLRHVPLLLVRTLAAQGFKGTADLLARVIQRADELTEFLAIYWQDKRQPLSAQVKKGLARAFTKFNEYDLAKYNRQDKIKLRDVLFLSHAKPLNEEQAQLWKRLVNNQLEIPDTWEVGLSAAKDKQAEWTRLLEEKKLGALALLRNLRNMQQANVTKALIRSRLEEINTMRVLPFRFITAAFHAPDFEPELEYAMVKSIESRPKLTGETVILVDVSGSMDDLLSGKTQVKRVDAACALAMMARETCEHVSVFTFSQRAVKVPARRGFALRDAILRSQAHEATYLSKALQEINALGHYDRIIVITDEQSHDGASDPQQDSKGYMINVAAYKNGVGYGRWTHFDGFSEAILDYITMAENQR